MSFIAQYWTCTSLERLLKEGAYCEYAGGRWWTVPCKAALSVQCAIHLLLLKFTKKGKTWLAMLCKTKEEKLRHICDWPAMILLVLTESQGDISDKVVLWKTKKMIIIIDLGITRNEVVHGIGAQLDGHVPIILCNRKRESHIIYILNTLYLILLKFVVYFSSTRNKHKNITQLSNL